MRAALNPPSVLFSNMIARGYVICDCARQGKQAAEARAAGAATEKGGGLRRDASVLVKRLTPGGCGAGLRKLFTPPVTEAREPHAGMGGHERLSLRAKWCALAPSAPRPAVAVPSPRVRSPQGPWGPTNAERRPSLDLATLISLAAVAPIIPISRFFLKCHLCGWIERIPRGTGIMGGGLRPQD